MPGGDKIRSLNPLPDKNHMNDQEIYMMASSFDKARFNMVEQQIRPWEVDRKSVV